MIARHCFLCRKRQLLVLGYLSCTGFCDGAGSGFVVLFPVCTFDLYSSSHRGTSPASKIRPFTCLNHLFEDPCQMECLSRHFSTPQTVGLSREYFSGLLHNFIMRTSVVLVVIDVRANIGWS
jgi:hypothetical protein